MDDSTPPSMRIATLMPNLQPIERKVAQTIANDIEFAVEATADQIAAAVETSRTSVIRTAKALGYSGYQQLRVALTRELAARPAILSDSDASSARGQLEARCMSFVNSIPGLLSVLDTEALENSIEALARAKRVLIVASGLSGPLAHLTAQRLTGIGRPAVYDFDATGQKISASLLDPDSVCLVISGSGSTHDSLAAARGAAAAGATVIALTSFAHSPLAEIARGYALIVPTADGTFRSELTDTSRAALLLILEILCTLVGQARGEKTNAARRRVLSILESSIEG